MYSYFLLLMLVTPHGNIVHKIPLTWTENTKCEAIGKKWVKHAPDIDLVVSSTYKCIKEKK